MAVAPSFLPPGAFVDPSHVIAIWVEPALLARVGVGALPLDYEPARDRKPPEGIFDEGPVPAKEPVETFTGRTPSQLLDGFPTGSVDVPVDYLYRLLAFMSYTCDVVRIETKGSRADAPLRLTGYGHAFDETKPIVIAAIAPRMKIAEDPMGEWGPESPQDDEPETRPEDL